MNVYILAAISIIDSIIISTTAAYIVYRNNSKAISELQTHQNQLVERNNILDDGLSKLESAFNIKSRPQYVVSPEHGICSKCHRTVARFYLNGGSIVCANCDPEGFKGNE